MAAVAGARVGIEMACCATESFGLMFVPCSRGGQDVRVIAICS